MFFDFQELCKTHEEPIVKPAMVEFSFNIYTVIKLPLGKQLINIFVSQGYHASYQINVWYFDKS